MTPPYRMLDDATGEVATGPNGEKWEGIDIPPGHKMELFDTTSTDGSPWMRVSPSEIVRPDEGVPPIDPPIEPPIEPPVEGAIQVGPDRTYKTVADGIAAAPDGGTIEVDPSTYTDDFATISKKLTIRGVGSRPRLIANRSPSNGKGIFVTQADITVENIEFSGCKVSDLNGAGIRYEGGNLVVKNCLFHDNQNGMLCSADPEGTITITSTEFNHNGAGDGYSHNIYVNQVKHLTMDQCHSHDAVVGHQIKSRAKKTTITNSRIDDGEGDGSYNIDLPECGDVMIQKCTLQQASHAGNSTMVAYGMEKGPEAGAGLLVDQCSFTNEREAGVTMVNNNSSVSANVTNNTVSGITEDQILKGPGNVSGTVYLDETPPFPEPGPEPEPEPTPPTGEGMDYPKDENELRACLQSYCDSNYVGMLDPRTSVDVSSCIEIQARSGAGSPWGVNGNYAKINGKMSGDDCIRVVGVNGVNNRGLTIKNLVIDGGDAGNMSGGGARACLNVSAPLGDSGPIYRFHIENLFVSGAVNGLVIEGGVYEGEVRGLYAENCTGDGVVLRHLPNIEGAKNPIVSNVLFWHLNSSRNYGAGLRTVYSVYLFGGSFILNGGGGVVAPDGIRGAFGCNGENTGGDQQAVFDVPSNGYGSVISGGGEASSDGQTKCRKWNGSAWEDVGKPLLYYAAVGDGVQVNEAHVSYYGGGDNPMRVLK